MGKAWFHVPVPTVILPAIRAGEGPVCDVNSPQTPGANGDAPPSKGIAGYLATVRGFSANARLFLMYALLSGLGTGVWNVMFNLYLLRLGYSTVFVGLFWMVDMLFHGLFAFPAGLIGDKIGRRRTFILATIFALLARGSLLFVRDTTGLLVLAALAGMGEGFHAVAGAPFMMENSEPEERPHLFSINASFSMISIFVGSLSAGFLTLFWAGILDVPDVAASAARWALVTSLPLTFISLVPLSVIREKPAQLVESFRDLFALRNMVNHDIVFKLVICSALSGIGFGLTTRFFNVFFSVKHDASDDKVGFYLAIGALASAASVLLSPWVSRRWGMAKGIMVTQLASLPFLLLLSVFSDISVVMLVFVMRAGVASASMPLSTQLSMAYVVSRERATTAGMTHMAFDLGGAMGAVTAGALIGDGEFMAAFTVAAGVLVVPAVFYYRFFREFEEDEVVGDATTP
jgi:MFS family permease